MTRSKSYSALSRKTSLETTGDAKLIHSAGPASPKLSLLEDHEHMRTYFVKFIDLVICRELRRLTQQEAPSF
jgi:hypothetical protein